MAISMLAHVALTSTRGNREHRYEGRCNVTGDEIEYWASPQMTNSSTAACITAGWSFAEGSRS